MIYRLEGSGDPLLLIHGWGVSSSIWDGVVPLLASRFQLIIVELPGLRNTGEVPHGQRYYEFCATQLAALRAEIGLERWSILAYSIGTRVAERYIQRHPDHVSQVIFLCPLHLSPLLGLAITVGRWLDSILPLTANWWISGWRLKFWLRAAAFGRRDADLIARWAYETSQQSITTLKRMLLEIPGRGQKPIALPQQAATSALYVWGVNDVLVSLPRYSHLHDVYICARHSAPLTNPDGVAAATVPFLERGPVLAANLKQKSL